MSSIFSDERSHRLYNHLRVGYGGYIDPTYITNVLSEYDNIDITIVRPYRNINGIITQKSTDNLEDYYVIPKYMSLARANIANTYIYNIKIKTDNSDKMYYCYASDLTRIVAETREDIIKLINWDYCMTLKGIIESWRKYNPEKAKYFEKSFEKLYKDINKFIDIELPVHYRLGVINFKKYYEVVSNEIIGHTEGKVVRTKRGKIDRIKKIKKEIHYTDKQCDLEFYYKLSKKFIKDYIKIPLNISENIIKLGHIKVVTIDEKTEYMWTCVDDRLINITNKSREGLFVEVNRYINSQIERIIKES